MTAAWSRAGIDQERAVVEAVLRAAGDVPREQLAVALTSVLESGGATPLARKFLFACAALSLHAKGGGLTTSQVARVSEIASSALRVANVNPTTSKLSFLYGELLETLQKVHVREGLHEEALWDLHVAHHVSRKAPIHDQATRLEQATLADLRLGLGESAAARMRLLRELVAESAEPRTLLLEARIAWLTAEDEGLGAKLAKLETSTDMGVARGAAWLNALVTARAGRSFRGVVDLVLGEKPHRALPFELDAWFLTRTLPTAELGRRLRSVRQLKDAYRDEAKALPAVDVALRCALELEQAHEAERPLHQRLRIAQRVFRDARRMDRIETELLVKGAVIRWLVSYNQMELAASLLASYRALCLGLSCGRRDDLHGLLGDIGTDTLLRRYLRSAAE